MKKLLLLYTTVLVFALVGITNAVLHVRGIGTITSGGNGKRRGPMKMKKCVLVCLFLIFLFPTSNALSVDFYWAYLFSNHSKNIDGAIGYSMIVTVGVDSYPPNGVTLDLPDKGTQIRLDPWGPHVWDPTYYEYGKVINNPPPGDWYETSYRFLADDGTSSPLFSHATNNIFPMDFVQADISGGKHPTITWEPVDFADRYNIRFFDTVTGERLFEEFIDEDGSTSYSYQYVGNLFEEHEKLRIRITARDQDDGQIVNWSHVSYEHSVYGAKDVPSDYWAEEFINKIYENGITSGCSQDPLMYCPDETVTRAQMAVFLERGINGRDYDPPGATGVFDDCPVSHWAADWVEQFYNDGITSGCSTNPLMYCPDNLVTRAQMAVFLLRSMYGNGYTPPSAAGIFDDVPVTHWAADWIEKFYDEGITGGCSTNPPLYCPDEIVNRAQMAVFIVRAFDL